MDAIVTKLTGDVDAEFITDYEVPNINDDELLVKTLRVGICGTDVDVMKGFYGGKPKNSEYLVLGHECVGRVERVGSKVKKLQPGDVVVLSMRSSNCECENCGLERYDYCITGKFSERGLDEHGFASTCFKAQEKYCLKVPRELEDIAVLTEPASVSEKILEVFQKARSRLPSAQGKNVLVLGAGTIGQLTARLFKLKGFNVTLSSLEEKDSNAAKIAKLAGIEYVSVQDLELKPVFDGVLECTGSGSALLKGVELLASNGTLVSAGIPNKRDIKDVDVNELMKNLVVGNRAVIGEINSSPIHFEKALQDLKQMKAVKELITHEFKPSECKTAFETFLTEETRIKVVFDFT